MIPQVPRWAAIIFLLILVLAAVLRLATFDRYLPFEDYTDEVNTYALAQDLRGVSDWTSIKETYGQLSPFYIHFTAGVQNIHEFLVNRTSPIAAEQLYILRLIAVVVGVVTTGAVASIAWQLAGAIAGNLAAFIWGVSPAIVELNSLAIPDPFVYLWTAIAFAAAVAAWQQNSYRWLLVSLIAGILNILTKYWIATTLLPFGLILIIWLWRDPRRTLPWLLAYVGISLVSTLALFGWLNVDAGLVNREADTFRATGFELAVDVQRNHNNWVHAIYPITTQQPVFALQSTLLFLIGTLGGALAWVLNRVRQQRTVPGYALPLLLLYSIITIAMSASFSQPWIGEAGKLRHVFPTTIALITMFALGAVQIIWFLQGLLQTSTKRNRRQHWVAIGVLALVLVVMLPGYIGNNAAIIQEYQKQHVAQAVWQWADANLVTDGYVLIPYDNKSGLDRIWNRSWGSYDGDNPIGWWHIREEEFVGTTPSDWMTERNIHHMIFSEHDYSNAYSRSEVMREFIDQLTLIKTISVADHNYAGFDSYVYQMLPPQNEVDYTFGETIRLLAYDLSGETVRAGDAITLRLYWQGMQTPTTNYNVFIHLYPSDEVEVLVQHDGTPVNPRRPSLSWDDPDELLVAQPIQISVPDTLSPGTYRLAIGLYDFETGERLSAQGQTDNFIVIPIEVIE